MGSWGFDEDDRGKMLRYKIESKDSVAENALAILKRVSAYKTTDPKKEDIAGFKHTDQLKKTSEKFLNTVYGKMQAEHKSWKEKFDNSQE